MTIEEEKIRGIGKVLNDETRPLKERFRALFSLKNIGGQLAIEFIEQGFKDPSALLKHELAYCLGQMQDPLANPVLIRVLKDVNQEPMVRHEAGNSFFFFSCFALLFYPLIGLLVIRRSFGSHWR